ncbi:MAG: flavin reductase domain protein FMN-binding protein [Friedmanniella sp.]|nr:flavin reductase domain protein FMN-binding protein [Friedmanniella sp.]
MSGADAAAAVRRVVGVPGTPEALRATLADFSSGVTVVTTTVDGVAHAMTATAFCSVSLEPPLVLVCVSRTSRFHAAAMRAQGWAVSLLAADQEAVARHFSDRGRDLATQFDTVPHDAAPQTGVFLVAGALAWLECRTHARYDGGDHTILVGEVLSTSEKSRARAPLTYYRGSYS